MMESIRSAANSLAVKIIFGVIILCFIFTGVGFFGFSGGNSELDAQQYIAKIDGEGISRAMFEDIVERRMTNAHTPITDPSLIQQLRRGVLTNQINQSLMRKFSNDLNVAISNEQIKDAIRQDPIFFGNGQFNNTKYLNLLAQYGYTPDRYAEVLRNELKLQQVENALSQSVFALPSDSAISRLIDQQRFVHVVKIDPSILKLDPVVISENDEQKYYDDHKNDFFKKERVKFKYIENSRNAIMATIKVSDDELMQYYEMRSQDYTIPEKKAYSIIFITEKNKADTLAKQLNIDNFSKIAESENKNNHVSQYGKNGSLGWFISDDTLPQPFKEANLTKKNQISSPIKVDDGYLIIKLDDIQKKQTQHFDLVKDKIKQKVIEEKTDKALQEKENVLQLELANNTQTFEEIAKKVGLKVIDSGWIYENDQSSILSYPEIHDVIFGSEMISNGQITGKISDIIPVGSLQEDSIVVQVTDYRPEGIAAFDDVKNDIHDLLHEKLTKEQLESAIKVVMNELNEKGQSDKIRFAQQYTLTRDSTALDSKVIDMVFSLVPPADKPVFGVQLINGNSGYIVQLDKVEMPTVQRDLSSDILYNIATGLQYYLSLDLTAKAKIEIMPNANL